MGVQGLRLGECSGLRAALAGGVVGLRASKCLGCGFWSSQSRAKGSRFRLQGRSLTRA